MHKTHITANSTRALCGADDPQFSTNVSEDYTYTDSRAVDSHYANLCGSCAVVFTKRRQAARLAAK